MNRHTKTTLAAATLLLDRHWLGMDGELALVELPHSGLGTELEQQESNALEVSPKVWRLLERR